MLRSIKLTCPVCLTRTRYNVEDDDGKSSQQCPKCGTRHGSLRLLCFELEMFAELKNEEHYLREDAYDHGRDRLIPTLPDEPKRPWEIET